MLHQSLQTEKAFECPPINDWTLLTVTHFLVCAQTLLESQFRRKARKRGMKIGQYLLLFDPTRWFAVFVQIRIRITSKLLGRMNVSDVKYVYATLTS